MMTQIAGASLLPRIWERNPARSYNEIRKNSVPGNGTDFQGRKETAYAGEEGNTEPLHQSEAEKAVNLVLVHHRQSSHVIDSDLYPDDYEHPLQLL